MYGCQFVRDCGGVNRFAGTRVQTLKDPAQIRLESPQ
jgi:hypothetical protein